MLQFPPFGKQVSRRWRALSFDGQMWAQMDLHQFLDHISPSVAIHILFSVATFLNALDLRGWDLLPDIAVRRSLAMPGWNMRLQRIDLRFCSQLTRATLEGILDHSPRLRHINFRGLDSVDWSLIMLINKKCPGITFLDASFCGGERLEHEDISLDGQWRSLKSLKLAGGMVGPGALGGIGRCMPNLEVLDLSYSQYIDDDELLDFVKISPDMAATAWGTNDSLHIAPKIVRLRPSQAGLPRTAAEEHGLVYRRITHLKHLSLSRCPLVTDQGCHYLAHAVPDLELLEVAYAGARLHDDGMIGLLGSCPKIRKIDLEGAADITDRLIAALTPPKPGSTRPGNVAGQQLESLSIGFAVAVTTDAVLRLLRHCPKLSYLGLDVSHRFDGPVSPPVDGICVRIEHVDQRFGHQGVYSSAWRSRSNIHHQRCGLSFGVSQCRGGVREANSAETRMARMAKRTFQLSRWSEAEIWPGRMCRFACCAEFLDLEQGREDSGVTRNVRGFADGRFRRKTRGGICGDHVH
jgi:F-box/leucine-rich repeat protein 2/20